MVSFTSHVFEVWPHHSMYPLLFGNFLKHIRAVDTVIKKDGLLVGTTTRLNVADLMLTLRSQTLESILYDSISVKRRTGRTRQCDGSWRNDYVWITVGGCCLGTGDGCHSQDFNAPAGMWVVVTQVDHPLGPSPSLKTI